MDDLNSIKRLISKLKPIETLGVLAIYSGVFRKKKLQITEPGLELIQYLFLTTKQVKSPQLPSSEQIIKLIDYSNCVLESFVSNRAQDVIEHKNTNLKMAAELARLGAQNYRNWSYTSETIEIISEMINPISDYVNKQSGYNLEGLSIIVKHIFTRNIGETHFFSDLKENHLDDLSEDEFINLILLDENLYRLINRYWLDLNLLSKNSKVNKEELVKLADALSFCFDGNLMSLEDVYNKNIITLKPFVKVSQDNYVLFSITAINSFYMEIIGDLVSGERKSLECFNRRRSKYIELKTFEVFKKYFPSCEVYNDFHIDNMSSNQKDIIVKFGDIIILIEVKSNGINKGVRNSGVLSLKKFLDDTIVSAHHQTLELKNKIENQSIVRLADTKDIRFIIDPLKTRKIYRLVVLFRELGGLHTNLRNFKELTGDLGNDISVITLTDLMVVFDILSSQSERLDYLLQRLKLESNVDYIGDEVDLLGYYLLNRFDIDFSKYQGKKVKFEGYSESIDRYKSSALTSSKLEKPRFEISPYWKKLIAEIEHSLGVNSRPIISQLYRFNVSDQLKLYDEFKLIFTDVKFHIDPQHYQCIDVVDEKSRVLIRFIAIKFEKMSSFKESEKMIEQVRCQSYSKIFVLYLNSMKNGEYAGGIALSTKNNKKRKTKPLIIK
ncbi:hypothetical protein D5018_11880 [Parashewanella curva]|uniref:NERD domain-containing protein n=1 Tax=Parashewanella curva TaxID=2338552 RepID=A0A3L8PXF2_9GAMM|nr:hypothetical protein [Parashewanella curva]RLV59479.1 hypothetical protein D5018_11880 [Parashewanella curva]